MKVINKKRIVSETTQIGNSGRKVNLLSSTPLLDTRENRVIRPSRGHKRQRPCMGCRRAANRVR